MGSLPHPRCWMVPPFERTEVHCLQAPYRITETRNVRDWKGPSTFLFSKQWGRKGRWRKETNAAVEEMHPVLPSGSNSCLVLNKYLRASCSQVMPWYSLFLIRFTQKHKRKMQLQQINGNNTFKIGSKHFILQKNICGVLQRSQNLRYLLYFERDEPWEKEQSKLFFSVMSDQRSWVPLHEEKVLFNWQPSILVPAWSENA